MQMSTDMVSCIICTCSDAHSIIDVYASVSHSCKGSDTLSCKSHMSQVVIVVQTPNSNADHPQLITVWDGTGAAPPAMRYMAQVSDWVCLFDFAISGGIPAYRRIHTFELYRT